MPISAGEPQWGSPQRGEPRRRPARLGKPQRSGANLSLANLSDVNLSDADLDGADLSGANLNRTNLWLANLSNAQLTGVQWQLRAMRGCYLGVRGLDSCFGNALFKRAAADQDYLDTLEAHLKGTRGMALFRAWGLIGYGRSLLRVATISFGLAAIYGAIYRIFPHILDYKDSANTWFTLYISRSSLIRRWALVMYGRRPSQLSARRIAAA